MYKKCFGSRCVEITSPDRILFPDSVITKDAMIDYYIQIAPYLLPYTCDRLLSMRRFPEGILREGFFQKDAPDYFPAWIKRQRVKRQYDNGYVRYVVCNTVSTLVYIANSACIELHVSLSKIDRLYYPQQLIFDIDPSGNDFASVKKIAVLLRQQLEQVGLIAYVKLTGSRGLHVVVPVRRGVTFESARLFARTIAQRVVDQVPRLATLEVRKKERKGRVFIDVLRNGFSATAVAPYSIRALEGAPIAAPILWEELDNARLSPQQYTINTIFKRLARVGDVWQGMSTHARGLPELD